MKIVYFDCFAGISGDMVLGALLDAGLPVEYVRQELKKLSVNGYSLTVKKVLKNSISGSKCVIEIDENSRERKLQDIIDLITASALSQRVKNDSITLFRNIATVEAEIHNKAIDDVHFHEIGGLDSIIDIVGAAIGMEYFNIEKAFASHIHLGSGFVQSMHGTIPVPAPATAALLHNVPVYSTDIRAELTTPTGAALVAYYAESFGAMPHLQIQATGYGAGSKDLEIPNLLRIFIGEMSEHNYDQDRVLEISTNIDDMNPEFYDHVFAQLFANGALDVFITPIIMKKSRPAHMLTVLTNEQDVEPLTEVLFSETSTSGIRISSMTRKKLQREHKTVTTPYGNIRVKILKTDAKIYSLSPEYEDCKKCAVDNNVPVRMVYDAAKKTAQTRV